MRTSSLDKNRAAGGSRARLAVSTAIASAAVAVYGTRSVQAGSCFGAPGTYFCAGPAGADVTQSLSGGPLAVTVLQGFGLEVASGDAFSLTGQGGLTFTDPHGATISGSVRGIDARNTNGGALTVTASGTVTGDTGDGVYAYADSLGADLTITVGEVRSGSPGSFGSGEDGIEVRNRGGGVLSITASGAVTSGIGPSKNGVEAVNEGTALIIDVSDVTGDDNGIDARNDGTGALAISSSGAVTGTHSDGIRAVTYGNDLTIFGRAVSGSRYGIYARNRGFGRMSIGLTGAVSAGSADGIYALNEAGSGLSIHAGGGVYGGNNTAINAVNRSGSLSITASEIDTDGAGVRAINQGNGPLSVATFGEVSARGGDGIYALNDGGRALTIAADAVSVSSGVGISAENGADATDLTIDTFGRVAGGNTGIVARNAGTGALSVRASGAVTGGSYDGIRAVNHGTDLDVDVAAVTGSRYGIDAFNSGDGGLSITASGAVTGGSDQGIRAINYGNGALSISANGGVSSEFASGVVAFTYGDGLAITTTDVTVGRLGIYAYNGGEGALSVTAGGDITAGSGDGIFAKTRSRSTTDLSIDAGRVAGGGDGIIARHWGKGALSITGSEITGGEHGIDARNIGLGSLTVTTSGLVSGWSRAGIRATNQFGNELTITTAGVRSGDPDVSGSGDHGIYARHSGFLGLTITASGDVSSGNGPSKSGIVATNEGFNLTIDVAGVLGDHTGIEADNEGGVLSIRTSGRVVGRNHAGIYARNYGYGDLTIDVAEVEGSRYGILASNLADGNGILGPYNDDSGALSITARGAVSAEAGTGVYANNEVTESDLELVVGDVTGADDAIRARNNEVGVQRITVTGKIMGGSGQGIDAATGAAGTTVITLASGASVQAASGVAIREGDGDSTVTVETGAAVTGAIGLSGGADSLLFAGGDFSGVTDFDGGDGDTDLLAFGAGASGVLNASLVRGFESVVFDDGSAVSVFDTLMANVAVEAGALLSPGSSPGQLNIVGHLAVASGGTLNFELGGQSAGTEHDRIDVAGDAKLAPGAVFEIAGVGGFQGAPGEILDILVADRIDVASFSDLTFDFGGIGGTWEAGLAQVGGRDAVRLTQLPPVPTPVPVPVPLLLLGTGLACLAGVGRLRRSNPPRHPSA